LFSAIELLWCTYTHPRTIYSCLSCFVHEKRHRSSVPLCLSLPRRSLGEGGLHSARCPTVAKSIVFWISTKAEPAVEASRAY